MSDFDSIKLTLTKDAAVKRLAELTDLGDLDEWTVVKDGLTFETSEHGSVHVRLNLYAVISASAMADIVMASGLVLKSTDVGKES